MSGIWYPDGISKGIPEKITRETQSEIPGETPFGGKNPGDAP